MRLNALLFFAFLAWPATAAIWPDQFAGAAKMPAKSMSISDRSLFEEYGLEATEQAEYASEDGEKKFNATAWRTKDSTGALALFEAQRPPKATAAKVTQLAVSTSDGVLFAYGNYVLQFSGYVPTEVELKPFFRDLPRLEQSPLPALISFLPSEGVIANSERYIVGPVSLQKFRPEIPPSVAAFHMGAEAQFARYTGKSGAALDLTVFNYPTPQIARDRVQEFQKINGAVVKRSGPLVAVLLSPSDPDEAERLLAKVNYQANISWNEKTPNQVIRAAGNMLMSIITLAGIIVALCVAAGVAFAGIRILRSRGRADGSEDGVIALHLDGK